MKITKEEFKEFVKLYLNAWETYCGKAGDVFNTDYLGRLMFPAFNWLEEKLGFDKYGDWFDLTDLKRSGIPVEYELIQIGENEYEADNIIYSKDLDVIYDRYLGGHKEDA